MPKTALHKELKHRIGLKKRALKRLHVAIKGKTTLIDKMLEWASESCMHANLDSF